MDVTARAKHLIENEEIMTIATADSSGKPWVSPVGFSYDSDYNLYWVSSKDAQHSANVRSRPQVAIVIFGPVESPNDIDGVYFDAEAQELEDKDEIVKGIENFAKRPQSDKFTIKSMADVTDNANWRLYRVRLKEVFKRANATHSATGQAITIREKIDLI